jgi:hypothetical protein
MADANATITLNATNIRLATFAYGNAEAVNKPTNHLGIASIPYEAVQRINPTWITFILCGALVSGSTWQQRLAKERRAKKNRA